MRQHGRSSTDSHGVPLPTCCSSTSSTMLVRSGHSDVWMLFMHACACSFAVMPLPADAGSLGIDLHTLEFNGPCTMPAAAVRFQPLLPQSTLLFECFSHLRRRVSGLPMHSAALKGLSEAGSARRGCAL